MGSARPRFLPLLVGVATLTLAQAVLWSPVAPLSVKAVLIGIGALAWWRPAPALLITAILLPFGRMLTVAWIDAFPVRGAEAVALAFLGGAWLHTLRRQPDRSGPVPLRKTLPWILLATLVVASAAVVYRVFQVQQEFPGTFFIRLLTHVATDYHGPAGDARPWADSVGFEYVNISTLVLQGIALMLVTARITAARPTLQKRLIAATVLAGCGAAGLSLYALLSTAFGTGSFLESLPILAADRRWAEHVTKVNSAGSYFVLVAPLAVGLAIWDRRFRSLWLVAGGAVTAALILTGSMAALLPALVAAVVAVGVWIRKEGRYALPKHRRVMTAVVLAVSLLLLGFAAARVRNRPNALAHVQDRLQLSEASLRMAADRPVFGVGIGQYALESAGFISDDVRAKFAEGPLQPHNYPLQLLTELGPAGLLFFAWGLAVMFSGVGARHETLDPAAKWPVTIGLALFLASTVAGQPLLLDTVALPFWIVMGLLMGRQTGDGDRRRLSRLLAAGVALILVTVPFRMAREVGRVDLAHVVYGAPGQPDPNRDRVRVVTRRARFFVPARSAAFEIETYVDGETGDVVLGIEVSGEPMVPLPVAAGAWRPACVDLAHLDAPSGPFRPVDLTPATATGASPTGSVLVAGLRGLESGCPPR